MPRPDAFKPMPVKYWSFAGLLITCWCNARCACCYLCCSPQCSERMTIEQALAYWRSLIAASPHGCRVHISGGEPFGDWEMLIDLARRAGQEGLGPLDKVETNAFWATDEEIVCYRLLELDKAGMGKIVISTDPYHQQYIPIAYPRLAARVAKEVLGEHRVQIRWRDWLECGYDLVVLDDSARNELFAKYAQEGRDRLCGRAAEKIAPLLHLKPISEFADNPCRQPLLRCRHVHIDPSGNVFPGVCVGLVLGRADRMDIAEIWRKLEQDYSSRPILGTLSSDGPLKLAAYAQAEHGFMPAKGYAGKCHLCWAVRSFLYQRGLHHDELGPAWLYQESLSGRCDDKT